MSRQATTHHKAHQLQVPWRRCGRRGGRRGRRRRDGLLGRRVGVQNNFDLAFVRQHIQIADFHELLKVDVLVQDHDWRARINLQT